MFKRNEAQTFRCGMDPRLGFSRITGYEVAVLSPSSVRSWRLAGAFVIAMACIQCRGVADARKGQQPAPSKKTPVTAAAAPDSKNAKIAPTPTTSSSSAGAFGSEPAPSTSSSSAAPSTEKPPVVNRPELPRGGRELFPAYRMVGFCGTPGAPALGRLAGNLSAKTKQMQGFADKYADRSSRKIMPVLELIAVVVQGAPGADGKSRRRVPDSVVDEYLQAARAAKGLLLLNIQPGHSDFLTEAKHFDKYLRQPDVGLALDPEWQMKGKQKAGAVFGQTTGAAINEVADYLAEIVKTHDLPEKAIVFHQVNGHVVKDESVITTHPGVAFVKSVDGLGPKGAKIKTYNFLIKTMPSSVHAGFKLFFDEDTTNGGKLMSPEEVLALTPEPEYVMYE